MSEITSCSEEKLCKHMESRVGDRGAKGLSVASTLNLETGKVRMLGVVYKTSAKDSGVLLNVCPWCEGRPGYFERSA